MRKGTKMAMEPRVDIMVICEVLSLQAIDINRVLKRDFTGNKSLEIVQLLCGQCLGGCYKQQTYVAVVAIF